MELLLSIIPHGLAVGLLAVLPVLRAIIALTDKYIAQSPDKHDDKGWAKIKSQKWFQNLETVLKITVGLELPKK